LVILSVAKDLFALGLVVRLVGINKFGRGFDGLNGSARMGRLA
jgi:hypothetical protein